MDEKVVGLIERRVILELEDRRGTLGREVSQIKERMSARGVLYSSMTIGQVRDLLAQEARVRTSLVWNTVARALSAAKVPLGEGLNGEIKELIRRLVEENSVDLQPHLNKAHELMRKEEDESIQPLLIAAFERIDTEVDLAVLAASPGEETDETARVVNIYQTQGIVQTGTQSTANLSISIGVEEKEQMSSALLAIKEALEQAVSVNEEERAEVLEIVTDTQVELEKDVPNRLKVRGALSGLASTVQTMAGASEAYPTPPPTPCDNYPDTGGLSLP